MASDPIEQLKRQWTDKYVMVDSSVPELRRFAEWTGRVKTVNFNGRALVQFDSPADIGWYDIDPTYLKMVDAPVKKEKPAEHAKPAKATEAKPAPAAKKPGASPLDMIRAQGAAKAGTTALAPAAAGEKPLSPMEQIRRQGAAKAAGQTTTATAAAVPAAPVETVVATAEPTPPPAPPKPEPTPAAPSGKPLSPIEMIRKQGPAKR